MFKVKHIVQFSLQTVKDKVLEKHTLELLQLSKKYSDNNEKPLEKVCKTFVRKYTHARLGGHIRGRQEQQAEVKGHRSKGGSTLRDKLYHTSGAATKKKSK